MRLRSKASFVAGYALLSLLAFALIALFAVLLKHPIRHQSHTHIRVTQSCAKVACAAIGDTATYTVHGRVTDVSEPQPGVVCAQLQSSRQAAQVCEPK